MLAENLESGREVAIVDQNTNERYPAVLDASSNAVFSLPPATYYIEGAPGDFVEEAYSLCSTTDAPGTDIGHPVTLSTGDSVVCDYYYVPSDASALPTDASAATESAPSSSEETNTVTEPDQDQEGFVATIYVGTCEDESWSARVGDLTNVGVPQEESVGSDQVDAVSSSFSTVPVSWDELVSEDHVLVVADAADPETPLACGAIGGVPDESGGLATSLQSTEPDSGLTGIAYYVPVGESGDEVSVTVFLIAGADGAQGTSEA